MDVKSVRVSTIKLSTDCICPEHLASIMLDHDKENNVRLVAYHSLRTSVAIQ